MATTMPATPDSVATPVTGHERIDALDTLRGVAVLGILVMNIYAFAMPFAAYMNPLLMGGLEWYNLGTWFATHIFFDQKFMTIFSMLFGAGLVLMWERAEARQTPFGRVYYRRQFWLLVIGAMHAYLLWFGDILFFYALIGMLIYPLRRLRPRTLVVIACILLPVALLSNYGGHYYMTDLKARSAEITAQHDAGEEVTEEQQAVIDEWREMRTFIYPDFETVQEDVAAHRGGYLDALAYRAPLVAGMHVQATIAFMIWRVGGLMILGMAFMKLGILSGKAGDGVYRRLLLAGYGIGLPLAVYSCFDLYAHQFDGLYFMKQGSIANYVGSIFVAFGHIALVMLIVRAGLWQRLMRRFSAVGRMAFTNYLVHSLILTTVFFGYGLGLYGEVPRLLQMPFVAAVIAFQLWLCPWWLARYRFGPAEWLWRSLTYWHRQPMRR